MRSPHDHLLRPVTCSAALALRGARILAERFMLDPTRPCAPTTANRVDEFNRRARNCSNFRARHRLAAGRELPYALLPRPILSNSNWKLTQYSTKLALMKRSKRVGPTSHGTSQLKRQLSNQSDNGGTARKKALYNFELEENRCRHS